MCTFYQLCKVVANPEFVSRIVCNIVFCASHKCHGTQSSGAQTLRKASRQVRGRHVQFTTRRALRDAVRFHKRYRRRYNFRVRSRGSREWREIPRAGYRPGLRPVPRSPRVRFLLLFLRRCSVYEKHPTGNIRMIFGLVVYLNK